MISAQVLMNCIEELRMITRVNLAVFDLDGAEIVSTFESSDISPDMLKGFAQSPADSQVIGMDHLRKITDEGELVYVLVARPGASRSVWRRLCKGRRTGGCKTEIRCLIRLRFQICGNLCTVRYDCFR